MVHYKRLIHRFRLLCLGSFSNRGAFQTISWRGARVAGWLLQRVTSASATSGPSALYYSLQAVYSTFWDFVSGFVSDRQGIADNVVLRRPGCGVVAPERDFSGPDFWSVSSILFITLGFFYDFRFLVWVRFPIAGDSRRFLARCPGRGVVAPAPDFGGYDFCSVGAILLITSGLFYVGWVRFRIGRGLRAFRAATPGSPGDPDFSVALEQGRGVKKFGGAPIGTVPPRAISGEVKREGDSP